MLPASIPSETRLHRVRYVLFGVGVVVSVVMAWRAQVGFDQYWLLVRGWMFYSEGWVVPFGNHMSAGGFQPGGASALLVGLPLFLWEDYRAISLSIVLTHVVAYFLLDATVKDALRARGRLLLCIFYWLNPWRLHFSAHLWNPNWLFLLGVIHLWTATRMRGRASFFLSLLHVAAIGLAFHLHASFLILAIGSLLLWWRGFIRVHWAGAISGALLVLASLVPWLLTALDHPEILPGQEGFPGRGLVTVYPVLKGLMYWLRYPVWYFSGSPTTFDFTPTLGATLDAVLVPFYRVLTRYFGPITVLVSIFANVWLWRRRPDLRFARFPGGGSLREWLKGYVRWLLVAAVTAFALSPTTITAWQVFIAMHASVLAVVFWIQALRRTRWARTIRRALVVHVAVLILVLLAMSLASPMYRDGGRQGWFVLVQPHPMNERLGLIRRKLVEIDVDEGIYSPLFDGPEAWYVPEGGRM